MSFVSPQSPIDTAPANISHAPTQGADTGQPTPRHGFTLLWLAATAGALASWVMKLALPLIAVQLTRSPLLVSGVSFALMAPWLAFGLQTGALVDRLDRKRTLLAATILRLAALTALAATLPFRLTGLPALVALYATALALGLTETFTETAVTALTPTLVAPNHLERANAWLIGAQQVVEIAGSPLGGAVAATGLAVGLGGAGYVVALLALFALRGTYRPARPAPRHLAQEIADGMRFLWGHTPLRTLGIMAAVINASWTAWLAVFVLYAVAPGPLRLTSFQYGLLLTGGGVGGLAGVLLVTRVQRWLGRRWAIGLNILGNTLLIATPAFTTNPWLVGAVIILGSAVGPLWTIAALSMQQRVVPAALQGRVAAAYRLLGFGAEAIGPVVGGVVAQMWGAPAVFWGGGALTLAMFIPFLLIITNGAMG